MWRAVFLVLMLAQCGCTHIKLQGKTISQNILTDWMDPDGDDLVLMDAKADNEQDQVKVRRDGLLTYQDSGAAAGNRGARQGRGGSRGRLPSRGPHRLKNFRRLPKRGW